MKAMTVPVVNQPTVVTGDNPHYLVRGVKRHPSTQASESHDFIAKKVAAVTLTRTAIYLVKGGRHAQRSRATGAEG